LKHAEKPPDTSPSQVVSDYLEALKRRDFGKTYDFISSGYAANLDKQSYELNMRQGLDKYHWTLLDYQVLGVQILGDQAFVLAELEVRFKPDNSERETQKKVRVQYGLTVSEKKWKISQSNCILNCVSAEDFAG
jgi:ketosteroid isomerase-like protein